MLFDKARASAYLGFGLATIADYQRRGELDKAELMTLLMLVALEKACSDSGRWFLAWLMTHQPEPPWHSIRNASERRVAPVRSPSGPRLDRISNDIHEGRSSPERDPKENHCPSGPLRREQERRRKERDGRKDRLARGARPRHNSLSSTGCLPDGLGSGFCDSPTSVASLALSLPRRLMGSGIPVGHYLRTCMRSDTSQAASLPAAGLWPIPPAYPWEMGPPPSSGRRRQRWFRFWAAATWMNLTLFALSFFISESGEFAPFLKGLGMPLIAKQQNVAQRVHGLSELMCRPPYLAGGRGQMKLRALLEYLQKLTPAFAGSNVAPPAALADGEFQASRAKFLKRPLHFGRTPWLSVFSAATYIEPDSLLPPDGAPATQWEPSPLQQQGSEEELLSFVREWEKFGKLHFARPIEVPSSEQHQLLPVPKDESIGCIVHDRRPRNAKETTLALSV